jgi:hypothetical protein
MQEQFIGQTKKRAQDLAEQYNLIFHLVSIDGEKILGYPEDKRQDRICVEINNKEITKVELQ